MKKSYHLILLTIVGVLVILNISLFARAVVLGDTISKIEYKTEILKTENTNLEKEVLAQSSFEHLMLTAQVMGFSKQAEPITLDTVTTYALRK